jgi:ComF family protein
MLGLFKRVAVFIQASLDVILPRKERVIRVETYRIEDLRVNPEAHEASGISITTLLSYRDTATEDLIRAVKYDGSRHAARLLAEVLAEYLREEIASIHTFSTRPVILIPLPLHAHRAEERGFNQIEFIMEQLPEEFRDGRLSRIEHDALMRTRETRPQTRLTRAERLINVKDAFAVRTIAAALDCHAFVIDDVTTTGATLAEAVRPLQSLNIPVSPLALARA